MYLTIDSKNPDYQFIHIDMDRNYGVVCKFKFYPKDASGEEHFAITHALVVKPSNSGSVYQSIKSIQSTIEADANDNYNYKINADLRNDPNSMPGEERDDSLNNKFVRKTTASPTRDNIIDLHIEHHPADLLPRPDYGDGWCKFYII